MELNTAEEISDALAGMQESYSQFNKTLAYKCVQKAKVLNDLDLEFDARFEFLRQLVFLSEYEAAIALYPWFLNMCDKHPDRFNYFYVLWAFKWIMGAITDYHKISLGQLSQLFKEFEKRFLAYGSGQKVILHYKMRHASEMGNIEASLQLYEQYELLRDTGPLDDCIACQPNNSLSLLIYGKKYDKVIEITRRILDQKLRCHVVPHTTYPQALEAAMMLEDWENAERYFQLGAKKMKASEAQLNHFSSLILYCALKGNEVKGRNFIEKQLPFALETASDFTRCRFFMACFIFFQTLADNKQVKLKVKPELATKFLAKDGDAYNVADLVSWFRENALLHARLLDARNENSFYTDRFHFVAGFISEKRKLFPSAGD